ncbi:MAG TPA: urease accessory UreF family protein [Vicinamibacterales bacterium]|nr:urease accessory UreF family protein [Vicinamibacterales bacterium]
MSLLVWQLIDSSFPAGGFAHSGGLEAGVQHGLVADSAGVLSFARHALAQAGRSALPLVTAAHREPASLPELDRLSDVFITNPVANRASRAQGRAFLTSVARSFPRSNVSSIQHTVRAEDLCPHFAPMFGAVLEALAIDRADTQRAFLFITVRGVSSAAVRLGLIGAYEAQEAQAVLAPEIERTIQRCGGLAAVDIAQTAPLIDLCQSTHDRLYSRLFQS